MSCTKIETIGMRTHNFSYPAEMLVWIQIPGLSEEHLSLVRFQNKEANQFSAIEEASCIGKIWNYNLTDLRPESYKGLLSQMSGSPNITGTCQDFDHPYIWNVMLEKGFPTFILETGVSTKESLSSLWNCAQAVFKKDPGIAFKSPPLTLFKMEKAPDKNDLPIAYFHSEIEIPMFSNIFYDKSCQASTCYSSSFQNIKSIYDAIRKKGRKFIFIIRDFRYEKFIKAGQFDKAQEVLSEVEKIYEFFLKSSNDDPTFSLVVSSSSSLLLDFPEQGPNWSDMDKLGKITLYKRSSLVSTVFATGASAENFCGVYQEFDLFQRMINRPPSRSYLFKFF